MAGGDSPSVPDVESERLLLRWLSPAFLQASVAGDLAAAERELGVPLPKPWPSGDARPRMEMRLEQMTRTPDAGPWLLRAMIRRSDGAIVGFINFHGVPDVQGRAELGYTVFEAYRRQGYASEAARAMMRWAHQLHGVTRFVVSISPANLPSLRLADALGFQRVGGQIDETDGEEWVFELEWRP